MKRSVEVDFRADTANHQMNVLHDYGTYRHIRFQRPGNPIHWFELVTWPGCLTIHGDMGTWTFSRTHDMFDFFRGKGINPGYWAEKLRHGMVGSSERLAKVFSEDTLREQIKAYMDNWDDEDLPTKTRVEILDRLEGEVLIHGNYEHEALTALFNFKGPGNFRFDPCDGPFGLDWSYHYLWCCWAIVFGIEKYSAEKLLEREETARALLAAEADAAGTGSEVVK